MNICKDTTCTHLGKHVHIDEDTAAICVVIAMVVPFAFGVIGLYYLWSKKFDGVAFVYK